MVNENPTDALFAAAQAGDLQKVKELLAAGVPADARNSVGYNPLTYAAREGHEEVFFTLVKAGADVHAKGQYGGSVLCAAIGASEAHLRMVQAVLAAGGVSTQEDLGLAFASACGQGPIAMVEALLAAGADVNDESRPLVRAVANNRVDVVALLLKAGARPEIRVPPNYWGKRGYAYARKRVLEMALTEGFTQVANLLQAAGAKLPLKKNRLTTPASVADSWKRIDCWLIENAPGWNPLCDGASDEKITQTEEALGVSLPEDIRDSYRAHDGSSARGFFPSGLCCILLPLAGIVRAWKMWKRLVDDGEFANSQPKFVAAGIRCDWWNVGWIPFTSNGGGDCDCVDLVPDQGGKVGQLITMNHESGEHRLLAPSFRHWLYQFANDLEDGLYQYEKEWLV
jgi:cell wall assembly regulator SMI1